jgi:hypothetical protein
MQVREAFKGEFEGFFRNLDAERCTSAATLNVLSTEMWNALPYPLAIRAALQQWANSFKTTGMIRYYCYHFVLLEISFVQQILNLISFVSFQISKIFMEYSICSVKFLLDDS